MEGRAPARLLLTPHSSSRRSGAARSSALQSLRLRLHPIHVVTAKLAAMKKLLACILLLVASAASADGVEFTAKAGWIRAAPPGAKSMAGYVSLGNTAKQPL